MERGTMETAMFVSSMIADTGRPIGRDILSPVLQLVMG